MAGNNSPVTRKDLVFILAAALIVLSLLGEYRLRRLTAFINFKFAGV